MSHIPPHPLSQETREEAHCSFVYCCCCCFIARKVYRANGLGRERNLGEDNKKSELEVFTFMRAKIYEVKQIKPDTYTDSGIVLHP